MSDHRYKKVKPVQTPQVRYSDAVRKWGDQWAIDAPSLHSRFDELTKDAIEANRILLMERGQLPRA